MTERIRWSDGGCPKCGLMREVVKSPYCRSCNREYKRAWYQKNRESEISRCAAYNKLRPDVPAASMRRCRAKDPERYREMGRKWRRENQEKCASWYRDKHARRKHAQAGAKVTAAEWRQIKEKFRHRCFYCGAKPKRLTVDHFVPLSRGGKHIPENIRPACCSCNSRKQAILPDVFAARMGRLFW